MFKWRCLFIKDFLFLQMMAAMMIHFFLNVEENVKGRAEISSYYWLYSKQVLNKE